MKNTELREMDNAKLIETLGDFRKELFDLRFQHATAQLENTARIREVKKTIARIMTIQRERQGA